MRISIINPIIFKLFLSYFSSTKHPRLFSSSLNYREYFHLSTKHPEHVSGWVGLDSNKKKKRQGRECISFYISFFSLCTSFQYFVFFSEKCFLWKRAFMQLVREMLTWNERDAGPRGVGEGEEVWVRGGYFRNMKNKKEY